MEDSKERLKKNRICPMSIVTPPLTQNKSTRQDMKRIEPNKPALIHLWDSGKDNGHAKDLGSAMRTLIVLGAIALVGCAKQATSPYGGCTDPSNTSSGITCEYLAQQDATWRPATDSPLGFSVVLTDAGYDNIQTGGFAAAQAQLAMLLESGASCIRIDIGYDAWLNNQQNIQDDITSLVDQIRSAGKCLIIADAAAERYRKYPLPWIQFQQAWVQRVQTLYGLYRPDFYILVKEPGWYVPMVSDALTNPDFQDLKTWVTLVQSLEAAAPGSKDGVAIEGGIPASRQPMFVSFLRSVAALSGTDFIGFDQYGANDQTLDISLIHQVQTAKSVWIAEAWSTDYPSIVFDPARASLDATWMRVEYDYAQYVHATSMIPFYDGAFASYSQPPDYTKRTPIFYTFQQLATAHGTAVR